MSPEAASVRRRARDDGVGGKSASASRRRSQERRAGDKRGGARGGGARGGGGVSAGALFAWAVAVPLAAYCSVMATRLANAPVVSWAMLAPLAVHAAAVAATWAVLKAARYGGDPAPMAIALGLAGLGMAMHARLGVYSGDTWFSAQLMAYPIGAAAMVATALVFGNGRAQGLARAGWLAYAAAVAALCAMLALGHRYRGGVYVAGNLNPSEVVKPLTVLFLAAFLSGRKAEFSEAQAGIPMPDRAALLLLAAAWAVPMALVLMLHDLGLLVLLNAVLVAMMYAITRRAGYLALGAAGVAGFAVVAGRFSAHAQARFAAWRAPFDDPTGKGWQILQSLAAFYSGGAWGSGLGRGMPQSVPIATSDFVYSAFGEELGFIGCLLIVALYGILFAKGWRIAGNAAGGPFGQLLGAGITAALAAQALLNIGGVTKAIPLTGITLPFLSQGGSSMAVSLVLVGLLSALSAHRAK